MRSLWISLSLKKTTDDCYTPPEVYETVKEWAVAEYGIAGRPIVRPFYPGGDFENFEYPPDGVVLDNPPFSIMKKIVEFYQNNHIDFFLFANGLSLFTRYVKPGTSYVVVGESIIYENGADIQAGFITSLDKTGTKILLSYELQQRLKQLKPEQKTRTKMTYPDNVISGALLSKYVVSDLRIAEDECAYINALDSQRGVGSSIYGGGGMLISDGAFRRIQNAKHEYLKKYGDRCAVWELSEREREIIASLGEAYTG